MKKLLKKIIPIITILVLVFSFYAPAHAAPAIVQTAQGGYGYVNTFNQAMGSNVTAGDTMVAELTAGDANTISSFGDNNTNTWTLIASDKQTGQRQTWLYYAYNVHAGATTITVTWGASQFADANIIIREYSGLVTTDPLDKSAHANDGGSSTSHSTGTTAATTQASELVVAAAGASDSQEPGWTVPSGYSNLVHQKGSDAFTYGAMADLIVSSTGAQSATFTTTDSVAGQGVIATFKAVVTAVSGPPIVKIIEHTVISRRVLIK